MPQLRAQAIVCSVRAHGEHGAIARLLTREAGLVAGYVRGGRSRRMRPVLIPGNRVDANFRARTSEQLAGLTVELTESRGPWLSEPLPAAAIGWVTALTASTLPEGNAYPDLHDALGALLDAICHAPSARGWAVALVRYELLLLQRLGFAFDLEGCVVTGAREDLAFISPKSGRAVSVTAARGHEAKLLPLPPFLLDGGRPDWGAIFDGLRLTGFFLNRHFFADRPADVMAARQALVERLRRAHPA